MTYQVKKLLLNTKTLILATVAVVIIGLAGLLIPRLSGAQQCTSVETYDFLRDECFFECDSDAQCDELSAQVERELDEALKDSQTKASSTKPTAVPGIKDGERYSARTTGTETDGTVYTVRGAELDPEADDADGKLWGIVRGLIGTENVKRHMISFEVFDDPGNDTAASVWRSETDTSQWHMNINAAYATQDKKDLIRTIVHEYAHVITLSGDQVDTISGACPRIELHEGCGKNGSYIQSFYTTFWERYDFGRSEVGSISEKDAAKLYESEPNSFVSEYASTNLTEDVAESFTDFVVKQRPTGTAVKDKKVQYFYQFPELVKLRDQMRAEAAKVVL